MNRYLMYSVAVGTVCIVLGGCAHSPSIEVGRALWEQRQDEAVLQAAKQYSRSYRHTGAPFEPGNCLIYKGRDLAALRFHLLFEDAALPERVPIEQCGEIWEYELSSGRWRRITSGERDQRGGKAQPPPGN